MTFFCVVYWPICFMPHLPSNSHFYSSEYLLCLCVCVCVYASYPVVENLCTLNRSQVIGYLFYILPSYMISTDGFKTKRAKEKQLRILLQMSGLWHAYDGKGQFWLRAGLLIACSLNRGWPSVTRSLRPLIRRSDGCRPPVPILHVSL